ncbi:MAG: metallophosphoesterase family protein [Lentisphaeria bacterium]
MRYAVLADVHANRQALQAVLDDCRAQRVDGILSLGDLIGYGPAPAAVLELANARIHCLIQGNHEAALLGQMPVERFRDEARRALDWTAAQLTPKARRFIAGWPLLLSGPEFRGAHAEFADPAGFHYLLEPDDAVPSWTAAAEPLLFTGHTHVPGLFVIGASGTTHRLPPTDFELEPGKRYLVGAGSVGQPRDGDIRAAWVLYDSDRRTVWFRRTAFDIDAFRRDLRQAGLPEASGSFLGQAGTPPEPLREQLDFVPPNPLPADQRATPTVAVLEATRRSARRWRRAGLLLGVLAAALALALAGAWWHWHPRGTAWPAAVTQPLATPATAPGTDAGPAPPLLPGFLPPGATAPATPPLRDWTVQVADAAAQTVQASPAAGETASALRLTSTGGGVIEIASRPLTVTRSQRFTASAQCRLDQVGKGYAELALRFTGPDGIPRILAKKLLDKDRRNGWHREQVTLTKEQGGVPADGRLQFVIHADFTGTCELRNPQLQPRP